MKIVLTGGKYNAIHPGHIWLLKKAKKLGKLIVILAHEKHNKRSYAVSDKTRKRNIEKLKIANKVIVGSSRGFVGVVKKYKPNIIVLGYDQRLPDKITEKYVKDNKIKIIRFKKHGSYSTRKLHTS